jgi:serine protease Do
MLTNAHLLGSSDSIKIRFADGQSSGGKVVARDDRLDLALVRLDGGRAGGLSPEVEPLCVGSQVYVFGSPFAPGGGADASKGVIRATYNQAGHTFIQTNIEAMPDYGGGPLLDAENNVVGVAILGQIFDGPAPGADTFLSIGDALRAFGIRAPS